MKKAYIFGLMFLLIISSAFAFSGAGTGTELNPYQITNCTQLQEWETFQNLPGTYYTVMNDIDCSDSVNWNSGYGFIPIGENTTEPKGANNFCGVFDGQGYMISNIYQNFTHLPPGQSALGLFTSITDCGTQQAVVKNLNIDNIEMHGFGQQGALTPATYYSNNKYNVLINNIEVIDATILNYNTGSFTSGNTGGVIGNLTSEVVISNIDVTNMYVEGISEVGLLSGTCMYPKIENINVQGTINAKSSVISDPNDQNGFKIGGLCGLGGYTDITNANSDVIIELGGTPGFDDSVGVGGFIGELQANTYIADSSATSRVYNANHKVGGFIGATAMDNITIKESSSNTEIDTNGTLVGGFIGEVGTDLEIINSSATSVITGGNVVGGFIGGFNGMNVNQINIYSSYADANINSNDYVGGFIGYNMYENILMQNCYTSGDVVGVNYVGGFIGSQNGKFPLDPSQSSTIINSYSLASVTGTTQTGSFIGHSNYDAYINYSFALESGEFDFLGSDNGVIIENSGERTDAQLQTQSTFTNWDFSEVWYMDTYPEFQWSQVVSSGGGSVNWPDEEEEEKEDKAPPLSVLDPGEDSLDVDFSNIWENFRVIFQKIFAGESIKNQTDQLRQNYGLELIITGIGLSLLIFAGYQRNKDEKKGKGKRRKKPGKRKR